MKLVKEKLSEISDSFVELKSYVDEVSNQTYDAQRDVSTKIDDFKNSRTEINERITSIQGRIDEVQQSIEEVNNK